MKQFWIRSILWLSCFVVGIALTKIPSQVSETNLNPLPLRPVNLSNQPPPSISEGPVTQGIRCTVSINQVEWKNGNPIQVVVILENLNGFEVRLQPIPVFKLEEKWEGLETANQTEKSMWEGNHHFWCPIDLTKPYTALAPNTYPYITLPARKQIRQEYDLNTLGWQRTSCSVWPNQNLFQTLTEDEYKFYLEISLLSVPATTAQTKGYTPPKFLTSNKFEVKIGQ